MFGGGITFMVILITLGISIKFGIIWGIMAFIGLKMLTK